MCYNENMRKVSNAELEFNKYLESLGYKIERNNRTILKQIGTTDYQSELDIWFPELKIGIEFDGDYVYEDKNPKRMEHKGWGTRIFDYGKQEVHLGTKIKVKVTRVDIPQKEIYFDIKELIKKLIAKQLTAIAKKYGTTIQAIKKINDIQKINVGDVLKIPDKG